MRLYARTVSALLSAAVLVLTGCAKSDVKTVEDLVENKPEAGAAASEAPAHTPEASASAEEEDPVITMLYTIKRVGHEQVGYFDVPSSFEDLSELDDPSGPFLKYSDGEEFVISVYSYTKEEIEGDEDMQDPVYVTSALVDSYIEDYKDIFDRDEYFSDVIGDYTVETGDIYFTDDTRMSIASFLDEEGNMHVVIAETLSAEANPYMDDLLWIPLDGYSIHE